MTVHYYRLRDYALQHPECSAIMRIIFLISVIPATSQILVPEGNGIIASVPVSAESGAFR